MSTILPAHVPSVEPCDKAPKGWQCTRAKGHDGPCALVQKRGKWGQFLDGLGTAIGEAMFGGGR